MHELFKKIDAILDEHLLLNKKAMISCQSLGFNGFKRLHRMNTKRFLCWQLKSANMLFDRYRVPLHEYSSMDLKEHLATWDKKLEEDIKILGQLNKEYLEKSGVENCVIKDALNLLVKNHEKTGRWYKRFEETDWLSHDMHVVDDRLHDKFKKEEEHYD